MLMQAKNAVGSDIPGAASSAADLVPFWRPKRFQNRPQNVKKSILKNDTFLTSILEGFRPRFWGVLGLQLGAKSAALLAAPGVLDPTAFYNCINILLGQA